MVERFEKFSYAISELHSYLNRITGDEMERYGLKGSSAIYLFVLSRYENGITGAELSDLCFKNKSDVSRAMSSFEEKGLITKKGGAKNSYRAQITLTEAGKRVADALHERAKVVIGRISAGLSDEKRHVLYDSLELIAANMKGIINNENP